MIDSLVLVAIGVILIFAGYKWFRWHNKAQAVSMELLNLKKKIKKRNLAVDLDLATTSQIFSELSKRGRVILLIPHRKNNITFVETLAAQLSPVQTMDVLKVAFSGIANHLDENPNDEELD